MEENTVKPIQKEEPANTRGSQSEGKSALPLILIILGVIELVLPLTLLLTVVPQVIELYKQMNVKNFNPFFTYTLLWSLIIIALANMFYGIISWRYQEKQGTLGVSRRKVALALLIVGMIACIATAPITISGVILPIYSLTSNF